MGTFVVSPFCDDLIYGELTKVKNKVLTKDLDWTAVYDGEEGVGKSVLAMQHAKILDPNFTISNVVFDADSFIAKIREEDLPKGTCIILDEAFNAANSRASMTEVNRAMVALATEMRQKNLFVILVIPSFFDLDRYFALWRCRALFHVYINPEDGDRRYVVFDKESKKLLYIHGKKTYSYSYPRAPFAPSKFYNQYVIDELEYRKKKADAFARRPISNRTKAWILQRNALINELIKKCGYKQEQINKVFNQYQVKTIPQQHISRILTENYFDNPEIEFEIIKK